MVAVAKRLKKHLDRILMYFRLRVSNSMAEGINNKIGTVKKKPTASETSGVSSMPSTSTVEDYSSIHHNPGRTCVPYRNVFDKGKRSAGT